MYRSRSDGNLRRTPSISGTISTGSSIPTMDSTNKSESDNLPKSLPKNFGSFKDQDNHQHRFVHFKPITSMKVYIHQTPFSTMIKGLSPMSLIKCEVCNLQFISVMNADNNVKIHRTQNVGPSERTNPRKRERKISFEEGFAAYYNTSQLDAFKTTNIVQQ